MAPRYRARSLILGATAAALCAPTPPDHSEGLSHVQSPAGMEYPLVLPPTPIRKDWDAIESKGALPLGLETWTTSAIPFLPILAPPSAGAARFPSVSMPPDPAPKPEPVPEPVDAVATPILGASSLMVLLPGATPVSNLDRVLVVERSDDQLNLLQVMLDGVHLSDGIPAYKIQNGGLLLPLGELCRLLYFPIRISPSKGLAEGWFITPQKTFRFDALAARINIGGGVRNVDRRLIEIQANDIYVDSRLLSEWFPLTLQWDLRASSLSLTSLTKLPIQDYWEREGKSQRLSQVRQGKEIQLQPVSAPYRIADLPTVEQAVNLGFDTHSRSLQFSGSTYTYGDLLGLEHKGFFAYGNRGMASTAKVTLGRRDPDGGLLGPLRATQIQAGEVLSQGLELISSALSGTGILLSNYPLLQPWQFDRRTFKGILPSGWQVELYHNDSLIALQTVKADGSYEFVDVPVGFGPNEYRLVKYSPQGERSVETLRSDIHPTQVPGGEFRYRAIALDPEGASRRAMTEVEYGLSRHLSMGLGFQQTEGEGSKAGKFGSLNMRGYFDTFAGQATLARAKNGATAGQLALQSGYGRNIINVKAGLTDSRFESDALPRRGSGSARFGEGQATLLLPGGLSLGAGGRIDIAGDGSRQDSLNLRLSAFYRGLFLSGSYLNNHISSPDGRHRSFGQGDITASRFFGNASVRASVTYELGDKKRITQAAITADRYLEAFKIQLQGAYTHRPNGEADTIGLSAYRMQGSIALGGSADWSTKDGLRLSFNARTTIGRHSRAKRWSTSAQGGDGGSFSARAFIDSNGNGLYDPGEPLKEGVGFATNSSSPNLRTDKDGMILIPGIPAGSTGFIRVDESTLDDPTLHAAIPGFRSAIRAGKTVEVDFPIIALGELDGVVYGIREGKTQPVSGFLVELVDSSGKMVKQIRSAFDGYFNFHGIPPGEFTLRINEADAEKRGGKPSSSRKLLFKPTGTILDGQDLKIELRPAQPEEIDN